MPETVKFLSDVHVPLAIVRQARSKTSGETDIVRWGERGENLDANDAEIWAEALAEWRVVITADEDFLRLAKQETRHPGIIFIRPRVQGKRSIGPVVEWLLFLHEAVQDGAATLADDIDNHVRHIG